MAQSRTDPWCLSPIVQAAPLMSLLPSPSCCPAPSHRSRVCPQTHYKQVQQMTLQFLQCFPSCWQCLGIEDGALSARSSANWGFTGQNRNLKLQTAILKQIVEPSTSETVQDIRVNLWLRHIYLEQHWRVAWPFQLAQQLELPKEEPLKVNKKVWNMLIKILGKLHSLASYHTVSMWELDQACLPP